MPSHGILPTSSNVGLEALDTWVISSSESRHPFLTRNHNIGLDFAVILTGVVYTSRLKYNAERALRGISLRKRSMMQACHLYHRSRMYQRMYQSIGVASYAIPTKSVRLKPINHSDLIISSLSLLIRRSSDFSNPPVPHFPDMAHSA